MNTDELGFIKTVPNQKVVEIGAKVACDKNKQYATFSHEHDYSKHTSYETLSIKKRIPQFADSFRIERVMLTPMSYNPKKYIFTSATVGGITTGGIDKVGGNYVSGKKVDSGKCELKYFGQKIQRIQLTEELFREAKESTIKKYLNDKKQIVVEDETSGGVVASAQLFGVHSLTTQAILYEGYPTREKCQEIIDWICEAQTLYDICNSNSYVIIYLCRSSLNDLPLLFRAVARPHPYPIAKGVFLST